jgi:hypothetical protein
MPIIEKKEAELNEFTQRTRQYLQQSSEPKAVGHFFNFFKNFFNEDLRTKILAHALELNPEVFEKEIGKNILENNILRPNEICTKKNDTCMLTNLSLTQSQALANIYNQSYPNLNANVLRLGTLNDLHGNKMEICEIQFNTKILLEQILPKIKHLKDSPSAHNACKF